MDHMYARWFRRGEGKSLIAQGEAATLSPRFCLLKRYCSVCLILLGQFGKLAEWAFSTLVTMGECQNLSQQNIVCELLPHPVQNLVGKLIFLGFKKSSELLISDIAA